jgi:hypothetical protein
VATDDELLTAYVDGVGELTSDERRRVEQRLADDPALRADADAIRALLERTRELPGPAREPDWSAMERQIRESVGPAVPMPWWRRARWLAPASALVTTAAIALVWLHHVPATRTTPTVATVPTLTEHLAAGPSTSGPSAPAEAAPPRAPSTTLYIDGQVVDLSNVDPTLLLDDGDTGDDTAETDTGLLPAADYGWIDRLDDQAMDRAERWLARKKG